MALTSGEQTYFSAHKTLVLTYVEAIFSGLTTDQKRDLTCCAIALGMMNRRSTDDIGSTFTRAGNTTTNLNNTIYNFVTGTPEDYIFPNGETNEIPRNTRLNYRKALSLLNLYDYDNQQWETNLNSIEIKAAIGSLFLRFGQNGTNGWQKIFNNEFNLGIQDEHTLSVTNPILPASGRWGIVNATSTAYQELNSFETDIESSVTGGTNTYTRSTEQSYSGLYSMKTTYGNSKLMSRIPASGLSTSTAYTVTAWVYLPSNWDGGDVSITSLNFTGITEGTSVSALGSTTEQWQMMSLIATTAADATGEWEIRCASNPTVGRTMYTDFLRVTDGTLVWDATAQANNTKWEAISYLGHVYRDYQLLTNNTVDRTGGNEHGLDEVGVGIRNLQGYDLANVTPDMQTVDSKVYLSTEFKISGETVSFRRLAALKALEGKDYITW